MIGETVTIINLPNAFFRLSYISNKNEYIAYYKFGIKWYLQCTYGYPYISSVFLLLLSLIKNDRLPLQTARKPTSINSICQLRLKVRVRVYNRCVSYAVDRLLFIWLVIALWIFMFVYVGIQLGHGDHLSGVVG